MNTNLGGIDRIPFLISNLSGFATLADLRRSSFFAEYGREIDALLSTPEIVRCRDAFPKISGFLRVAQWNIEKGKRAAAMLHVLQTHPVLKDADLILLNESDRGMNRSGNLHIARMLADALSMHMAFGPAHLELTKGTDDDLAIPGENRDGLQGNAILSRHPIAEAHVVPLPVCFEPYHFQEKRYGRRVCLWVRLELGKRGLWTGCVHFEVRNTPRCRAAQMRHLLSRLPGKRDDRYLLGGDLNSNGFCRGTGWKTLRSIWRLLRHSPQQMKEILIHPERGSEPLFQCARNAGFSWEGLNSSERTASAPINGLEESRMLPAPVVRAVRNRLGPYGGYLQFKLDWLIGKNIQPLAERTVSDPANGIQSLNPGCAAMETAGPERLSDHLPIYADIAI